MENNFQRYITGLQHIGIPTNDLEATIAFYETFGFQVAFQTVNEAAGERVAFLRMGDVGCNFSWMFVGNFLMIFYTDVFGIEMSAVAGLMLFSRFWDAINDPVIGGLSDKTYTRWGRYRPWLLIAAPLTALVLMLTFWAHLDWSSTAKIIYMAVTYCILVLGYTCVNIPYGTLCGAMTQNIEERAKINTFRSVSAMIAIGIINIITVPLIAALGKGTRHYSALTPFLSSPRPSLVRLASRWCSG